VKWLKSNEAEIEMKWRRQWLIVMAKINGVSAEKKKNIEAKWRRKRNRRNGESYQSKNERNRRIERKKAVIMAKWLAAKSGMAAWPKA
jgi:hypothetical protein